MSMTMRRRCGWLVGLAIAGLVGLSGHAANLVPNSSFESGLDSWSLWRDAGSSAEVQRRDTGARHGAAHVRVVTGSQRAILHSEPIPARGEADYTLSAYVQTQQAQGARLSLWVLGKDAPTAPWGPDEGAEASAPSLLANPGFEAGGTGWTLWHADATASAGGVGAGGRGGGQAFHVLNPGTQGANLHSDPVPCQAGQVYTLTVYAKVRGGKGVAITGWARDREGKTLSYAVGGAVGLPAEVPEYRRFTVTFVAPAGSTELKAHLICNGGEVWWDDCRLLARTAQLGYELASYLDLPAEQPAWARFKHIVRTPAGCTALKVLLTAESGTVQWDAVQLEPGRDSSPYQYSLPATGANLLPNSGFADGDAGWTLWKEFPERSAGGVVDDVPRGDGRAFRVTNPGDGGANLHSDPVACTPGTLLTLSAYVRTTSGKGVQLAAWGVDGSGKTVDYGIEGPTPVPDDLAEYRRFSKTFTVPETVVGIKAHLVCGGGEVCWDDVQIEAAANASDYVAGPRHERLPPRAGAPAVAYTRLLLREARLRDVQAQTQRLVDYAPAARQAELQTTLAAASQAVDAVSQAIGAPYLVPAYREIDDTATARLADTASTALAALWRDLGHDAAAAFAPWAPPRLPANQSARDLAAEFLIFPCFTRPDFFEGEGNWEILEPFGFRVVSGWWWVGSDREGKPQTGQLDKVLRLCRQHGYVCDIGIEPAGEAARALGNQEEFFLHNATGGWSPGGNCHNTVNLWHPEVRRVTQAFLENLARHYAQEPAVLSYEMTNEPSLTIEQHVHGYEYRPDGVGCYSPPARAAWQAWLQERYGTVTELNRRWRTAHAAFADIAPPADLRPPLPVRGDQAVDTGALHDFQCFRAAGHAAWFRLCLEAFQRGGSGKAVISQFYSGPMERKDAAVDLRALAEEAPWDIYGTHDWPGDRPAVESLYAVSMNRRARRPHWEDEFIWSQWEKKGTPEPVLRAALERNLWRQIAWGKRGISLFNLESEWAHDSAENWNNSLLNIEADLEVPRYCTGVIPTLERKVNGFKDILYQTELGPVEVAILRPTASTLVAAPDERVRNEGTAIAAHLLRGHAVPLLIPEEHLLATPDALAGVALLVAPWAIHVPVAVQEVILAWVRAGGTLVASGPCGLFDEHGNPAGLVLRASLGPTLAWTYDAAPELWTATQDGAPTASLLRAACGQGQVVILREPFLTPERLGWLDAELRTAIPTPWLETALPNLEILPRQNAAGEAFLFVTNLDARAACQGQLSVRGEYPTVVDLTCEARPRIAVVTADGKTRLPVRLAPGGALFLRLGQPAPATPGRRGE
jgi:hypothetical protein